MPFARNLLSFFASLTMLLASASASAGLVVNGDFEADSPLVTGWTTSADIFTQRVDPDFTGSIIDHGFIYSDASVGTQGLLSQSLTTQSGAVYTLEFDLYRLMQLDPLGKNQVTVWFGAQKVFDETDVNQDWSHFVRAGLIASGSSTLLTFGIRGGDADYPALDNVSVIMTGRS